MCPGRVGWVLGVVFRGWILTETQPSVGGGFELEQGGAVRVDRDPLQGLGPRVGRRMARAWASVSNDDGSRLRVVGRS